VGVVLPIAGFAIAFTVVMRSFVREERERRLVLRGPRPPSSSVCSTRSLPPSILTSIASGDGARSFPA